MQTILGSNGVIGQEIAKALPQYTDKPKSVIRKMKSGECHSNGLI